MSVATQNLDAPDFLGVNPVGGNLLAPATSLTVPAGNSASGQFFYVGNVRSLVVQYQWQSGGELTIQPTWWQSPTAGQVGPPFNVQQFLTVNTILHYWQLPVIAPYMRFQAFNANGPSASIIYAIYGVMDSAPGAQFFPCQVIMDRQALSVPANGATLLTPSIEIPGKYTLWMNGTTNTFVEIHKLNGSGGRDIIARLQGNASGGDAMVDFTAPGDDWFVNLFNNNAAANNIYAVVTGPQL